MRSEHVKSRPIHSSPLRLSCSEFKYLADLFLGVTMTFSPKKQTIVIIGNQGSSLLNFRGPLVRDMVRHGCRVVTLAPEMDDVTARALRDIGAEPMSVHLSRTGLNPAADLATLVSLYLKLARLRPDAILSYAAKPVIYGTLAGWVAGVARRYAMIEGLGYVFTEQTGPDVTRKFLSRIVSSLYKLALSRARRVFFLNSEDVGDFLSLGLVSPAQVKKIDGIGVDLAEWRPLSPHYDPLTFTFVGRLLRDKGILDFVAAARIVKSYAPHARFLILGQLDTNPSAIKIDDVESWVREGVVEWLGHVSVYEHLARTSVFVLPSYREGLPRSTQEAMASAKPVITTDAPGCRDTVVEGENGFLVPPGDSQALAAAMQNFIDDPALIASMGPESRNLAEARFDVRRINSEIMQTMEL
jgi:glycosyltransferase involved in cell wall biosynthesis